MSVSVNLSLYWYEQNYIKLSLQETMAKTDEKLRKFQGCYNFPKKIFV